MIDAKLAIKGYGPIPESSPAFDFAKQINALYAAWWAERSLLSSRISKMESTRADVFKKDYLDLLKELMSLDLSNLGVARTHAYPTPYAGGISHDDKESLEDDDDRVPPRFTRGMFDNPKAGFGTRDANDG